MGLSLTIEILQLQHFFYFFLKLILPYQGMMGAPFGAWTLGY